MFDYIIIHLKKDENFYEQRNVKEVLTSFPAIKYNTRISMTFAAIKMRSLNAHISIDALQLGPMG